MLNDNERAELEEYRRQDRFNLVAGWILVGVLALTVGSFIVGAYKADAFFGSLEGGIDFGVDVMKMAKYYRGR